MIENILMVNLFIHNILVVQRKGRGKLIDYNQFESNFQNVGCPTRTLRLQSYLQDVCVNDKSVTCVDTYNLNLYLKHTFIKKTHKIL